MASLLSCPQDNTPDRYATVLSLRGKDRTAFTAGVQLFRRFLRVSEILYALPQMVAHKNAAENRQKTGPVRLCFYLAVLKLRYFATPVREN